MKLSKKKTNDGAAPVNMAAAPKPKKERARNTSTFSRFTAMLVLVIIFAIAIVGVNYWITTKDSGKTVQIYMLNSSVPKDGIIDKSNLRVVSISAQDYENLYTIKLSNGKVKNAVIIADEENLKQIDNKYAAYYLRANSPIFWDAIGTETPKQYSYLYNMDGELLKVSFDANTFGQMLVPGDHLNIRASYTETVYTLPTEEEYNLQQQLGISAQTTVKRQILLFNNVAILDMLNSNGESIFDKYYELISLPKEQQEALIASEDFQAAVQPSEILLNVTPEEADRYMSIQSNGPTYMMTLLPRTSSNAITEVLNELQTGFARSNTNNK